MEELTAVEGEEVVEYASAGDAIIDFFDRFRLGLLDRGCLSIHHLSCTLDLPEGQLVLTADDGSSESEEIYDWLPKEEASDGVNEETALETLREAVERMSEAEFFGQAPFALDLTLDYRPDGAKAVRLYTQSDSLWSGVRHGKLLDGAERDLDSFLAHLMK